MRKLKKFNENLDPQIDGDTWGYWRDLISSAIYDLDLDTSHFGIVEFGTGSISQEDKKRVSKIYFDILDTKDYYDEVDRILKELESEEGLIYKLYTSNPIGFDIADHEEFDKNYPVFKVYLGLSKDFSSGKFKNSGLWKFINPDEFDSIIYFIDILKKSGCKYNLKTFSGTVGSIKIDTFMVIQFNWGII
jgi:hypothetical protein